MTVNEITFTCESMSFSFCQSTPSTHSSHDWGMAMLCIYRCYICCPQFLSDHSCNIVGQDQKFWMIDAVKEHFKNPSSRIVYMGNFSGPEALNNRKMTHMGMMDTGFTVVAKEWVLLLFYVIHKLPFLASIV